MRIRKNVFISTSNQKENVVNLTPSLDIPLATSCIYCKKSCSRVWRFRNL